jgi:hypothetical protein
MHYASSPNKLRSVVGDESQTCMCYYRWDRERAAYRYTLHSIVIQSPRREYSRARLRSTVDSFEGRIWCLEEVLLIIGFRKDASRIRDRDLKANRPRMPWRAKTQ